MKRRGVEMRLAIGDTTQARLDPILIKTIARAHRWYEDLILGRVANLAILAPDIVEDIASGRQSADLTTHKLLRQTL